MDDSEYQTARRVLTAALADEETAIEAATAIVMANDLRRVVTALNEQTLRLEAMITELQVPKR